MVSEYDGVLVCEVDMLQAAIWFSSLFFSATLLLRYTASFEDDTTECTTKRGTYLSATAFVFFFLCGCMLCCMPIAVEKTRYKKSERGSPPQSKQEHPPPATAPSVLQPARVHQTVVIPVVANSNDSMFNSLTGNCAYMRHFFGELH